MRQRALVEAIVIAGSAAAMLGLYWKDKVSAADKDTITWGAVDPTWSPDGKELAFSLFGGIWRVPAEGGEAVQVTSSSGYHAHPAWSPKGDWIAFVRGNPPGGRIPNVSGNLVLVNPRTGEEKEMSTPEPVAGTLAWSPDATRLAVPLRAADISVLLREVGIATGKITPIQVVPQNLSRGSAWIDTAWDARHNEVLFTAMRAAPPPQAAHLRWTGATQVWSTKPAGLPMVVQVPLTRYKPGDIALLDRLSAFPDGSGFVLSAVVVNGKGDYELYRVPRGGGVAVPITNTPRDEFSPAVSPDGKLIAHVSNHMGNVDLFTMPAGGGEKKHVRITNLKFRGPSAKLRVRTVDETGNPTPVRLYVRASDGKAYCPAGVQIFYYLLEPTARREGFFLTSGDDTFPLPAGPVTLTALKGVEYEIEDRKLEMAAGETAEVTISMRRWTNWAQRGWYTGENHYHANYNGTYYQKQRDALGWLMAEDLNAANMVVANSEGAFIHDKEFFRGGVDPLSTERYKLYWGQEYRNSYPLGHMAFLNIKKQVPPSFTSVMGSNAPYDYPLNTMAAQEARKQGGLVSYVHPMGAGRDVFDTQLGAKEMPIGLAVGAVDAIDVLPFGPQAYEMWYRFLNAGFKVAPGGGTDVFTNWRGINRIPGAARQYVDVGGPMDWARWVERYREGRTFVTNGPLLSFQVNGSGPGAVLDASAGSPYKAKLTVEVTTRVPVHLIEFLQNGNVLRREEVAPRTGTLRAEAEATVERSSWFAVRVTGQPSRGIADIQGIPRAHSGAVYVLVGKQPVLVKDDVELMIAWVDRLWLLLEERNNFGSEENRKRAKQMFDQARTHYTEKLAKAR